MYTHPSPMPPDPVGAGRGSPLPHRRIVVTVGSPLPPDVEQVIARRPHGCQAVQTRGGRSAADAATPA